MCPIEKTSKKSISPIEVSMCLSCFDKILLSWRMYYMCFHTRGLVCLALYSFFFTYFTIFGLPKLVFWLDSLILSFGHDFHYSLNVFHSDNLYKPNPYINFYYSWWILTILTWKANWTCIEKWFKMFLKFDDSNSIFVKLH